MKGLIKNPEGVHLNESRFRSYEPIIGEFLSTYPDLFVFSPTNRSLATVTSADLFLSAPLTDPIRLTGALPHWSPPLGVIIQPNGDDTYTML
jgi:hypothetical protein